MNLKKLRSIVEDVIKLGKEAYSFKAIAILSNLLKQSIYFCPLNWDDIQAGFQEKEGYSEIIRVVR